MQRREGRSKYNKIYQLQMNVQGHPALVAVTSVSGHLMSLDFAAEMKNWGSVTIENLFDAPVFKSVPENMKNVARTLKEESSKCDTLVVWTDCDREGENIGAEIAQVCIEANKNIDIWRARFSEITPAAINRAANNLTILDQNTIDAVDCRTELDLRIGSAFTRLQTIHLRQRMAQMLEDKQVVSYGSCQFPTLGFVVARYKEIESFVPESFWKLVIDVNRGGQKVEFHWQRGRLFDRDVVNIMYDDCCDAGVAVVKEVTRLPKTKYRPYAMDTVELEKLAVRKLHMSAKQAMSISEKLYSQGWISYPRTETNKFPKDFDVQRLVNQQTADGQWGDFAAEVLERGPNPRNGNKSDEAHPPIHPLKYATKAQLQDQEWKLYELVVRHFLACVSWDAKGHETKVTISLGEEEFMATGLEINDLAYMKVYIYDKWSDKMLPTFNEGETLEEYLLRIADGVTTPPNLLNEADLISLMDKFGIGTDATHAEHIEKIKERKYVGVQENGRFLPGYLGLALVDAYDEMGYAMSKPGLRADLEKQLLAICEGRRGKQEVLQEQCSKYRAIFVRTEASIELLSRALSRHINSNESSAGRNSNDTSVVNRMRTMGQASRRGRPSVALVPEHELPAGAVVGGRGGRGRGGAGISRGRGESGDEGAVRGGRGGARGARGGRGGARGDPPITSEEKKCRCGAASVQRTVQKEGPNKGRKFWTCAKPMGAADKCDYFEWAA